MLTPPLMTRGLVLFSSALREQVQRKVKRVFLSSFSFRPLPFRLISVLIFTYTYLCCIQSHKTIFRKQMKQQRLILGVSDYKPVSQTVFWIFHTRPL